MKYICITIVSLFTLFGTGSCNSHQKKVEYKSYAEVVEAFDKVMCDSTATWEEVMRITNILTDSIIVNAANEEDLRTRILAQDNGYMIIELIQKKYSEITSAGREANYDDIPALLLRLYYAENVWFYDNNEQAPNIWRDHYYVCQKQTEYEFHGYFHIMVTTPCDSLPDPTLHIFYPDVAMTCPMLVFSNLQKDGSGKDTFDSLDVARPYKWYTKDQMDDGFPMYAKYDTEVVQKMLKYDIVYLMFVSEATTAGDPEAMETARLDLTEFKNKWWEVNKNLVDY